MFKKLKIPYVLITILIVITIHFSFPLILFATQPNPTTSEIQNTPQAAANKLLRQGIEQYRNSEFEAAINSWQQALSIFKQISDRQGEATILGNIGIAYKALSNYVKAIEYQQQALTIQEQLDNPQQIGQILGNLGNAYAAIGEYEKALTYQEKSLVIARQINNQQTESIALASLGATYANLGKYEQAIDYYQQTLSIVQAIGERRTEGYTLLNLGSAYHTNRDYQQSLNYYQNSLKIAQEIKDKWLEGEALSSLGLVKEGLKDYNQAMTYYNQGLEIFRSIKARQEEAMTLNNRAHTLLEWSKLTEAKQDLQQAITILDQLRENLDDAAQISLFDTQFLTYNLFQQVLIANNEPDRALEISEHGRARAFISLLSKQNLTNLKPFQPITINEIKNIAKAENATLVEYAIIPDKNFLHQGKLKGVGAEIYIWVVKPTGEVIFRQVSLTNNNQEGNFNLDKLVAETRSLLFSIRRAKVKEALQQLYQILIEPITDLLPNNPEDKVIFISQGSLFLIPFPALQDQEEKYLIEKYTVMTAPSIQVINLTRQQNLQNNPNLSHESLVVGNPTMPKIIFEIAGEPQQLEQLPGAEKEAKSIATILNTQALLGDIATEETVVNKLPNAKIIHLATHGLLDEIKSLQLGAPGMLALAINNNPKSTIQNPKSNDGLLTTEEIINLKLKADLVVLSACNTGGGKITGDGVIGLSRAFLSAGAASVLVSLWSVPDAPTANLMTEFYRYQNQNLPKPQALRQAMLTIMQQYPQPKDWAAFTLIGQTNEKG